MSEHYNSLVFVDSNYASHSEMIADMMTFIQILGRNRQIAVIKKEEPGIWVVDYNHQDAEYGTAYPCWLYPDEEEQIMQEREPYENDIF